MDGVLYEQLNLENYLLSISHKDFSNYHEFYSNTHLNF